MPEDLFDAVYGCLIGGAIGDALGAPVEGWHVEDIRAQHGKIEGFLPPPDAAGRTDGGGRPGQITDDTALRHYLSLAIIDRPGRITPDDYARRWRKSMNPARFFVTERIVLEKLRLGMNPWETGRGQPLADAALMSIAPVGVINAGDPAQAYQDGFVLAGMNQDGIERDAAATVAAGVAAALMPGATVDTVLEVMREHSTFEVQRLLIMTLDLAETSGDADAFASGFYATMLDRSFPAPPGQPWDKDRWVGPTSRETLPAVVGLLRLVGSDPNHGLVEGASLGRDADTIASILGCLVGALHGAGSLRPDWVAECEAANVEFFTEADSREMYRDFRSTAIGLVAALRAEHTAAARRVTTLEALLDEPTPKDARL